MNISKHPTLFCLCLAGLVYFATFLNIQGVHSFGSCYMSVDRYLQLENGTVNSLQVSKDLYKIETICFFPLTRQISILLKVSCLAYFELILRIIFFFKY